MLSCHTKSDVVWLTSEHVEIVAIAEVESLNALPQGRLQTRRGSLPLWVLVVLTLTQVESPRCLSPKTPF